MAVLVEALSVVVRRDSINRFLLGGWTQFQSMVPNSTLCADAELARVGFMTPADAQTFVQELEASGLAYVKDGEAVDLVVVDQLQGPVVQCKWVEFGHVSVGAQENRVAAARMASSTDTTLATPPRWNYERSLSRNHMFVPNENQDRTLKFIRRENDIDVYLNLKTGEEVYMGRTS